MNRKLFLVTFLMLLCSTMFGQNYHWTVNSDNGNYASNFTIDAVIQLDGELQKRSNLELGVFSGETCYATAMTENFGTGKYIAELVVYGEIGHVYTLKLYDHESGTTYSDNYFIKYQDGAIEDLLIPYITDYYYGTITNPAVINFKTPNHYTPNTSDDEGNMSLTAVVLIDGVEEHDSNWEVGAFCGNICKGSAKANLVDTNNGVTRNYAKMVIGGKENDVITFKLYNHETKEELFTYDVTTINYQAGDDASIGTILDPFVVNFITKPYIAKIDDTKYTSLKDAFAAVGEGETIELIKDNGTGIIEEGTVKLPATLRDVTLKGAEGVVLKNMTISAADGNSYEYVGLTFDGITFDNSRLLFTGWRNGEETIEDLTVTNCTFNNLDDNTNTAPVHINKDAAEAVKNFTFTNNKINGATGGSKSGVYAQLTGEVVFTGNTINNVSFRPYVIQITTNDGIEDKFIVDGNTFSGSAVGRAQGLGNDANGTDKVNLVVSNNIFKGITNAQQICYWNFNAETTTADFSKNYYDIDILANPSKIYYNSAAQNAKDLIEMGVYPYYADESKTTLVYAPSIMVTYPIGNPVYPDGKVEYFENMLDAVPYTSNCPRLEGATITLLKDVSGKGMRFMENGMIFDLNGKTYTISDATGSNGTNTSGFQIRPEVTTNVIFKNGKIQVTEGTHVVWMFNCYATDFIVENVTVDCSNMAWSYGEQCYVVVSRDGDNVQFTGTTKVENFNSTVAGNAYNVGGTMTIGNDVVPGGTIYIGVGSTLTAREGLDVVTEENYGVVYNNGVYSTIKYDAKIGNEYYVTLDEAFAAAQNGNEVIVLQSGKYALNTSGKNITITATVDGVVFENIGAKNMGGANVTFNNVTFNYAVNSTYQGLQHSGNLVYNNCTFNGQVFLYGASEIFNNCKFENTGDNYNVWTYGAKEVAFNECIFNSAGKSVLIYAESESIFNKVTVTDCEFNASAAVDGKAAIEMDSHLTAGIDLTISNTTATGFGAGNVSGNSLWNNKKGNADAANNDITVVVDDVVVLAPIHTAKIGDDIYPSLQSAVVAVKNGETIVLLSNITENVTLTEKAGLKYTIDGASKTMNGNIKIIALSETNDDRRITIKNINFKDETAAEVGFIQSEETNHYPRITVEGCTFTGSGDATDVAVRLKSSHSVVIKGCTGTGLHSFLQNTSGWNLTIEGVQVTDSKSGLALGTVQGVTVKDCEIAVVGYGIRIDADTYNNNAVIESNTVEAFIPVVVRKANAESKITFKGTNTMTQTNNDGLWCAIGTSEYEENGTKPTPATGKVRVEIVNSENLPQSGLYGNHVKGTHSAAYVGTDGYWGECGGWANYSFELKFYNGDTFMGSTSLNDVGNIIDGDVNVTWNMKLDATSNTDEYWTMAWTVAPTIAKQPNRVEQWVDGVKVAESAIQLNGPDNLNPIVAAVADADNKITSYHTTFADAFAAGNNVAILKAGSYALQVKDGLTITGTVEGVEFANIGAFGCNGADVTFNNVTFNYAVNSTYQGLQHSGNLVYNNCTFNGQVFLYGASEIFNNCKFENTGDNYNVWTYGAKEVAFNECIFNSAGKSVLIYAESESIFNKVTVTDCEFNASAAVDGKAAIEMDSHLTAGIDLTISNTTATGFGAGNVSGNSLWNNKKGNADAANNDITVVVDDVVVLAPIHTAKIGDDIYPSLQSAVVAVKNGETIVLLSNITENVTLTEKAGLKYTIDGASKTMNGNIKIIALSETNDDRRITIKNINFKDETAAEVGFIQSEETNHYPRITVEGCTFTGSGDATDVAVRLKSSHSVVIKGCTGTGLHSFLQNTSGWNLTIENVKVTNSKSGLALGTVQGVTVKGCEIAVVGYGIRMDANTYNNNAVIESNKVTAFIPVVVRKANAESNITFRGRNTMTQTNNDGYWCVIGKTEYEAGVSLENGFELATGKVIVALNDSGLNIEGVYGNYYEATIDGTQYIAIKDAFDAAENGDEIVVARDINIEETINVAAGQNITLDLNGCTVSMTDSSNAASAMIKNNGNLTIKGEIGNSKLSFATTTPSAANAYASNTISNYGTITVLSGIIENTSVGGGACYAIDNYAGSTATIVGGKLIAEKTTLRIFNWTDGDAAKATLNIQGGEIVSNDGYGVNLNLGNKPCVDLKITGGTITTNDTDYNLAVYVVNKNSAENVNINVVGGIFNGNFALNGLTATTMAEGKVSISGGTFEGVICYDTPAYGFITGGTFGMDVNEYCHEYYDAVEYEDGIWTVERVLYAQTTSLNRGWNWYSSYINLSSDEGLVELQDALDGKGIEIKGKTGYSDYQYIGEIDGVAQYKWYKTDDFIISAKQMYMIKTTEAVEIMVDGKIVDPATTPITLRPGWNWIGYPVAEDLPINVALAGLDAEKGDVIKWRTGQAQYNDDINPNTGEIYGWTGSLLTLEAGQGYKYKSNKSTYFTYSTNVEGAKYANENITTDNNYWVPQVSQYANNMTITAMLNIDGNMVKDNYEIAAFANGECRGSARPIFIEGMNAYMLFMTVFGEDVEELTFKCYDINNETEYELNNRVNYSDDAILGSIDEPYMFFMNTLGVEESTLDMINIYPNPTTRDRAINLQATCDNVEVFNALGVKVAEYQNVDSIDALETAGVYVIRVTINGEVKNCRLVVE